MKNTFGCNFTVTLFGESHGSEIGCVLDGLTPGIEIDEEYINKKLAMRRPAGAISTARQEKDEWRIVSGVFEGKTTGAPLCIIIPNADVRSGDYDEIRNLARPGHADLTAYIKYHGFNDSRGGGHFSGRLTAPLVAAGAICSLALGRKGIEIATHISKTGDVKDRLFNPVSPETQGLDDKYFAVIDPGAEVPMRAEIEKAAQAGDSIGGELETAITGLPAGLGEPWFDTAEGMLAHAMFSIPAVKGIEFGSGFGFASMRGSEANDAVIPCDNGFATETNNNGGINGGITNGMPVIFRLAIKPTPTVSAQQKTVDLASGTQAVVEAKGRHDPCIVHRARAVTDAMAAITVYDLLTVRYGTEYFTD